MTVRYRCRLCNRVFVNPEVAFDHLVEIHTEYLEEEYIKEISDR